MRLIENWLSSGRKNFYVGLALYESLDKKDELVVKTLSKGPSVQNEALLERLLRKIVEQPTRPQSSAIATNSLGGNTLPGYTLPPPPPAKTIAGPADVMPVTEDSILESFRSEWMAPYQRMNFLRSQLHAHGNANSISAINDRKQKALEILRLEQVCRAIWERRDAYVEHGTISSVQEGANDLVVPTDPVLLASLIEATKRRIRDWRSRAAKDPANTKAAAKCTHYQDQYFRLTHTHYNPAA